MRVTKIPAVLQATFPNLIWNLNTTKKILYLTFDDGPTPVITQQVLHILNQFRAKATFFCIGKNVAAHPDIVHEIMINGHGIGNHTHDHLKGWKTNTIVYIENVQLARQINHRINQSINQQKLFRPPYGRIKPQQAKQLQGLGFRIVMWDVLSYDWDQNLAKEVVFTNVKNAATQGSIVVFHDSMKAAENMLYALPRVLEYFSNKGYSFEKLNVLLD